MPIKKKNKAIIATYAIFIGAIYLAVLLYFFHFYELKQLYPFRDFETLLTLAYDEMMTTPLSIFPIPGKAIQYALIGTGFCGFLIFAYLNEMQLKKHDNPDTVNGDSHWMTAQEFKNYNMRFSDPPKKKTYDGPNNIILSSQMRLNLTDNRLTRRNCNICVLGGSGTGKSYNVVGPNLLQANSSYVVTDPSGDLLNDYGKYLENKGYRVRAFNLVDTTKSSHYNPFRYFRQGHDEDVFIFVNTLIKNTDNGKKGGDPFWEKSETALLCALIFLLWKHMDKQDQKMSSITKLLRLADIDENDSTTESPLDKMFAEVEKDHPNSMAVTQYKTFKMGAGKTMKSILISCATRLQTFDLDSVKRLTDTDDIDFDTFADSKQALFIILPTGQDTFNYLASLMYTQLFSSCYDYVESRVRYGYQLKTAENEILYVKQARSKKESKNAKADVELFKKNAEQVEIRYNENRLLYEVFNKEGTLVGWRGTEEDARLFVKNIQTAKVEKCAFRCPVHIQFYMDEFANVGQVPNFQQKLATIRKYAISCVIILQSLAQLKEMYEKGWQGITGNCDTTIYLGGNDDETAKWLSDKLGKRTTIVTNESWSSGNTNGNTSYNRSSAELMPVSNILKMPDDDTIVIVRGQEPWYGRKYRCDLHPNYEYCMNLDPIEIGEETEDKESSVKKNESGTVSACEKDKENKKGTEHSKNESAKEDKKNPILEEKESSDINESHQNKEDKRQKKKEDSKLKGLETSEVKSDENIHFEALEDLNNGNFMPYEMPDPIPSSEKTSLCQTAEDILGIAATDARLKEWDSTMNRRRKEAAKETSANLNSAGEEILTEPERLSVDNMEKYFGSKDIDKIKETCSSIFDDEEDLDIQFGPDEIMYGSTP